MSWVLDSKSRPWCAGWTRRHGRASAMCSPEQRNHPPPLRPATGAHNGWEKNKTVFVVVSVWALCVVFIVQTGNKSPKKYRASPKRVCRMQRNAGCSTQLKTESGRERESSPCRGAAAPRGSSAKTECVRLARTACLAASSLQVPIKTSHAHILYISWPTRQAAVVTL